ncbi:MAG: Rid family hydrolase, partial [Chloroflexota bacterium]|nr:Rid family hydrolase [Chloroflexota bacterium]
PVGSDGLPDGFELQCEKVWANIAAVLGSAGLGPRHLVKVTTFLADRAFTEANGRIRRRVLGEHRPALTVVIAQLFDPAWLLEIEAIAAFPPSPSGGPPARVA